MTTPEKLTVAELKRRLTPGTRLRLVQNFMGGCDRPREVAKTTTTAVALTQIDEPSAPLSWLPWPKAADLRATPDGFAVYEGNRLTVRYVWEEPTLPAPAVTDVGPDLRIPNEASPTVARAIQERARELATQWYGGNRDYVFDEICGQPTPVAFALVAVLAEQVRGLDLERYLLARVGR